MLLLFTHPQGVKSNNLGAPTHVDGDNSLAIGASATWFGLNCRASVSSVRIYDRVLTDAEINEEVDIGAGVALTTTTTNTATITVRLRVVSSQHFNASPFCLLLLQMTTVSRGARTPYLLFPFLLPVIFYPPARLPACPPTSLLGYLPRLLTPLL